MGILKKNKKGQNRSFSLCNFFSKNRRGDIPVTILVLGVVAICAMAIASFLISNNNIRNSFVGIGLVEQMNSQIENKTFNNENPTGLYLEKNETRGILFWAKEVTIFSVKYEGKP